MNNAAVAQNKSRAGWTQLDKQLAQARSVMRRMRQTVEDIEDARMIERAKRANGKKPRIAWLEVKRQAGLE